jgi:hypothetical protein
VISFFLGPGFRPYHHNQCLSKLLKDAVILYNYLLWMTDK